MDQDEVIEEFVSHLSVVRGVALTVTCWPDKCERSKQDIDAVAEGESLRIAIEHTTIDTVPSQRLDDARFLRYISSLRDDLEGTFEGRVGVSVPFYALEPGTNWESLNVTLGTWLRKNLPKLPDGWGYHNLPGVPFAVHITKRGSAKPSIRFARFAPEDGTLGSRIASAVERKARKLAPYGDEGYETVILIENSDFVLMNVGMVEAAVSDMVSRDEVPSGLDYIWFADTSLSNALEFHLMWSRRKRREA